MRLKSAYAVPFAGLALWATAATAAPTVDPLVRSEIAARGSTTVVLTYRQKPGTLALARLNTLGISRGWTFRALPMVVANVNAAQLQGLSADAGIRSIYANRVMRPMLDRSPLITGALLAQRDTALRAEMVLRGAGTGLPATGRGIGVAVVDTGIDATHPDLKLGANVAQNVWFPTAENLLVTGAADCAYGIATGEGLPLPAAVDNATYPVRDPDLGFVPFLPVEGAPSSDVEGGHGTFVSGIIAGSGAASAGKYMGVAPGAKLIGLTSGTDCGLPLHGILQAYDYIRTHQVQYNIHVINNSWGSGLYAGGLDPDNPVNVVTREMHDLGMTVVFSAGNAGDTPTSINPYSTMPWVISVAASRKDGLGVPADFSSRGVDDGTSGVDVACAASEVCDLTPNLRPDVTAPGVDIKSTRSKFPGITNVAGTVPVFIGANDLATIDPGHLPYYTTSQGTSFSAPHVSGIVALMKQLNPRLTPNDVVTILRATANPMPFAPRVVGAGYVDVRNALRAVYAMAGVEAPRSLFPDATTPLIQDDVGDAPGTGAQDILSGDIRYDAAGATLVYTLTLANLEQATTNAGWEIASDFRDPASGVVTNVFVAAYKNADLGVTYAYGKIAPNPDTGINEITPLGAPAGSIDGNTIRIELPIADVNAATGFDVRGHTTTAVSGAAQVTGGPSFPDNPVFGPGPFGFIFTLDDAAGRDYTVE